MKTEKDLALENYLNGQGTLNVCPKCSDVLIVDTGQAICLNGECDYQLRVLEGGNKS